MTDCLSEMSEELEPKENASEKSASTGTSPKDPTLDALRSTVGSLPMGSFTGDELMLVLAVLRKESKPLLTKKQLIQLIGKVQQVHNQIEIIKRMQRSF